MDPENEKEEEKEESKEEESLGLEDEVKDEEEEIEGEKEEVEAKEEEEKEPSLKEIASQLAELQSSSRQFAVENAYLKGQLAQKGRPAAAEPEEEEDELDDEAKLTERLRANPAGTIKDIIRKTEERTVKRLRQEMGGREEIRTAVDADERTMLEQYPEIRTNTELASLATQIYQALCNKHGVQPGWKTLAAGTAYGELVRQGKLTPGVNGNGNVEKKPANLQLISPGARKPSGNGMSSKNEAAAKGSVKDPLAEFSASDRKEIEKFNKKMGITAAQYKKNYDAAKAAGDI